MQAKRPMYAVRLEFDKYIEFANWITSSDLYKTNGTSLDDDIQNKLIALNAQVYEHCEDASRPFDASDKVKTHHDNGKKLNISLPVEICRDEYGDLDVGYLEDYVQSIKAASDRDGALALLGMYFLSRCR